MATIPWTTDELTVFQQLGVSEENVTLRKFIRGQRKINGRLFVVLNLILDSMPIPAPSSPAKAGLPSKLDEARKILAGVPGPPPGCDGDVAPVATKH